ncbi:oligosaccharide flippase family protein [Sphingomonas flavescens]|uniref:oligosaccharide flippase family protein n=1 Tax=Sphingomonas flavescens TaxID=3132797 RepID=UPI003B21AE28
MLRIVSTVCLTRLLAPEVYGITGIIMSVFYMINMVTDIGLQAYVVRHQRSDDPDFLSSVWTIHAVRGFVLAAIGMALAWPLSVALAKPQLTLPLLVASLVLIIDGQVTLHQFRGLRDGRVQRYSLIDLVSAASQTLSAIILAFFFRNVWAIVASMFVASAMKLWAGYILFPGSRFRFRPDRTVAADLWKFSQVIAVSSALTLIIGQVDKLVLARMLPLSQFGIYVIAASLSAAPIAFAANYAGAIVYPAAAVATRGSRSIANAYYRCWGRFFYLYAFGGGALVGVADLLIRILYDPRYLPAAHYLSILAVSTALQMTTRSMESVQVASGHQRVALEFNVLRVVCLLGAAGLAFFRGQPAVLVFTIGLLEIPIYAFGLFRMSQLHQIRWGRELSLVATIVAGLIVGLLIDMAALAIFPKL